MKVLLLHGPNLNLLGTREPEKYGSMSSGEILEKLQGLYRDTHLDYLQSNIEGELVSAVHKAGQEYDGILLNPGAFSHTSVALADAVRSAGIPCICVHITNIYQREAYRSTDIVGDACKGAIAGLGTDGYALALECLADYIENN